MKTIVFYLPQFHRIPENDEWWGPGFTEWDRVRQAKPFFRKHHQPARPGELGYYTLDEADTLRRQAEMMNTHGVDSACIWFYNFGKGRRLLERPVEILLKEPEIAMPFSFSWANESWSRAWYGRPDEVLMDQFYDSADEPKYLFDSMEEAFHDPRYTTVRGQPLLVVYRPFATGFMPYYLEMLRREASSSGLPGLHLIAHVRTSLEASRALDIGFDGAVLVRIIPNGWAFRAYTRGFRLVARGPLRVPYGMLKGNPPSPELLSSSPRLYPCVFPNWDNTPRYGYQGVVVTGSTPAKFAANVRHAKALLAERPVEDRLVFVKSWNEWAEGNYLEPDAEFGRGWLEALSA